MFTQSYIESLLFQIVVHVKNNLDEDGLTIHWHGIHQRDTQWHDGVEYITQCPLAAGIVFP